jgi:hypothetical protein
MANFGHIQIDGLKVALRLWAFIMLTAALAFGVLADPAWAAVGSNGFCNSYVIPSAGTGGTVSAPLTTSSAPPNGTTTCAGTTTGGSTTSTSLTTVGGKLEANEQLVQVTGAAVNSSGTAPLVQGQTVWFQWTPLQSNTATITVTSNNSGSYQFQPIMRIYQIPTGSTGVTIGTVTQASVYSVAPNDKSYSLPPNLTTPGTTNYAMSGIFQSVALLVANAGTTYLIQVDGVATNDFPNVGQGNFTINLAPNQSVPPAPYFQPQSGWWYSTSYPGIGFAIEARLTNALLSPGAFLMGAISYDSNGLPVWSIAQGQLAYDPGSSVTGTLPSYYSLQVNGQPVNLNQYAGCGTLGATAAQSPIRSYGTPVPLTLRFNSATTGQLEWANSSQPLKIQRYSIPGSVPSAALPSTSTTATTTTTLAPATGWYWNLANETSYFIEQQSGALFMSAFMCRSSGLGSTPIWYVTTNTIATSTSYLGRLFEYFGGTPTANLIAGSSSVPVVSTTDRGQVSMTLIAPTATTTTQTAPGSAGTINLGGVAIPIARSVF